MNHETNFEDFIARARDHIESGHKQYPHYTSKYLESTKVALSTPGISDELRAELTDLIEKLQKTPSAPELSFPGSSPQKRGITYMTTSARKIV